MTEEQKTEAIKNCKTLNELNETINMCDSFHRGNIIYSSLYIHNMVIEVIDRKKNILEFPSSNGLRDKIYELIKDLTFIKNDNK